MERVLGTFEELQLGLDQALACNRAGSSIDHVLVALPSFSVGESLLHHYSNRIAALEHRYLLAALMLPRIESCELVFVSCQAPSDEVLDYYAALVAPERRAGMRARLHLLTVPDMTARSVAAKLLDRPDLMQEIRAFFAGRPAFIEPWNVTHYEVEVARQLGAPINGTAPELWPLGFKSAGRKLFAEARVPMAAGQEDVRSIEEVLGAIEWLHRTRPALRGVVVKTDDSGAGDGNMVIELTDGFDRAMVRTRLGAFPDWYLADLHQGAVVEELICGERFSSPSVQIEMDPSGEVTVLSTHEQILGGPSNQVYVGCRFPADPAYATEIARYGRAVGQQLVRRGARGRAGIDFAVAKDASGRWTVAALEINLRKGGTTHPYAALRNLVPGRYDIERGAWVAADGTTRAYHATDNLLDPDRVGRPPRSVIDAVAQAGLQFDHGTGTGVVLHMLSCLAVDGRCGLTAIGTTPEHAADLYAAAVAAVSR